ncbi:DNA recombination protein RmuC [Cupriavidus sp. AcVe19-6a]|uniref:DNA recombination protein RmuC n=1 Tax=Cupriavidus sp. AcVe19-6a TaxID=2821358 RepID=UPI001FD7DB06|nr:DNA recombination protein RmuC [Cupriavidus sp. AcVe19-6a]
MSQLAAAEAKASMQVEIASLTERLSGTSEALQTERRENSTFRQSAETWRTALDEASNEIATLSERSRRVPALEGQIADLETALADHEAELRKLSTENGQHTEKAVQLAGKLAEEQEARSKLQHQNDELTTALRRADESKAAFEQRALRVPTLEAQLEDVRLELKSAKDTVTELRESSRGEISRLSAELNAERETSSQLKLRLSDAVTARDGLEEKVTDLSTQLSELRTRTDDERQHAAEKLQLLVEAKEELSNQFKALASDILEEKAKRFSEQNQTTIGQMLEPLKTQLSEFKGKVEEVYVQEGKDRSALSEQVKHLVALNQTLSQDAKNLTLALKGQAKTQGNWGELILERVLEASGLRKGEEYKVQDTQVREDGTRAQPDVIIELPEERKLVVDAKVSLVAYDRFVSAENDEQRAVALRQHLDSVRAHIKGLSEKRYHDLYGIQSLDFVLAFVPIEPAFMLAVTNDNALFMDAWQRNVLLVSPSTLLFVVRTVAHLWRQESQSRNAQDIAKRGAELYDKLHGFVADLQKVGEKLGQAKAAYDDAHNKLSAGRGNVIRQAEMLRALGVKPSKTLPAALVQKATEDDEIVVPAIAALPRTSLEGPVDIPDLPAQ